jgi:hypothetical protein
MKVELRFCNGKTKNGMFTNEVGLKFLSIEFLYNIFKKTNEKIYKDEIKDDIVIVFEKYPINEFKLNSLKKMLEEREIEDWLEFDVFLKNDWENSTNLKKRKLDTKDKELVEPPNKRRKRKKRNI